MPKPLIARTVCLCLIALVTSAAISRLQVNGQPPTPATSANSISGAAASTTTTPAGNQPGFTMTRAFDHYVVRGGWITWLLLIPLSVTALALMIDGALTIRRGSVMPPETVETLSDLFARGAYPEAVRFVAEDRSALSRIILAGMTEARNGYAAMEHAMEDAIDEQAARFSRKIEYLNVIGNVAPMIGLFGTVQGIIGMFVSIADSGGIPVMSRISHDLGTALVATYWGLLVAIPSLSMFGLLRNRIDALLAETAMTADRLMSVFRAESVEPLTSAPVAGERAAATTTSAVGAVPSVAMAR